MACEHCGDSGWVCEDHPDQRMGHTSECSAGRPCPVCQVPGLRPRLSQESFASTGTREGDIHQSDWEDLIAGRSKPGPRPTPTVASRDFEFTAPPWDGKRIDLGILWRLSKDSHIAVCTLANHPTRRGEVRCEIDDNVHASRAANDGLLLFDLAEEWRRGFEAKGWRSDLIAGEVKPTE